MPHIDDRCHHSYHGGMSHTSLSHHAMLFCFVVCSMSSAELTRRSVLDFGAKGDGQTDDTAAIQAGINAVYERGGGTLYFPYAPKGYRIARPAQGSVDGKPCKSQLYIPVETHDALRARNICLEGEMPVKQLYAYQAITGGNWPVSEFEMPINNVCLISDWQAPIQEDANARPWSLISVLGGHDKLPFGIDNLTIRNLEFRVNLDPGLMYPTSSAAYLRSTRCLIVENCYFGLNKNVCSVSKNLELKANPCHTAGLIASGDQNDHQSFRSVGVQGFRYGFVFGEHTVADYLYAHNCGEAVVFHDSSHLSSIRHLVAQHNRIILSALRIPTFGLKPSSSIYIQIDGIDYETGTNKPVDYRTEWGVYDPDNRIIGDITHHSGFPCGIDAFRVQGGSHIRARRFGDWEKAVGAAPSNTPADGASQSRPGPPQTGASVVGTWSVTKKNGITGKMQLKDDGSVLALVNNTTIAGTWRRDGEGIVVSWGSPDRSERLTLDAAGQLRGNSFDAGVDGIICVRSE